MQSRSQQKLREHRERAALKAVEAELGDLRSADGTPLRPGEEPEWVAEAIEWAFSVHTDPTDRLPDDASPQHLDAWLDRLLSTNGLTGRLHVRTYLSIHPWLAIDAPVLGWTARLRDAIEEPWMFLSGAFDTLLIVSEAEYFYEAYVCHRPA
ncbi:hypothetical protein [Streptomyces griseosporeus]